MSRMKKTVLSDRTNSLLVANQTMAPTRKKLKDDRVNKDETSKGVKNLSKSKESVKSESQGNRGNVASSVKDIGEDGKMGLRTSGRTDKSNLLDLTASNSEPNLSVKTGKQNRKNKENGIDAHSVTLQTRALRSSSLSTADREVDVKPEVKRGRGRPKKKPDEVKQDDTASETSLKGVTHARRSKDKGNHALSAPTQPRTLRSASTLGAVDILKGSGGEVERKGRGKVKGVSNKKDIKTEKGRKGKGNDAPSASAQPKTLRSASISESVDILVADGEVQRKGKALPKGGSKKKDVKTQETSMPKTRNQKVVSSKDVEKVRGGKVHNKTGNETKDVLNCSLESNGSNWENISETSGSKKTTAKVDLKENGEACVKQNIGGLSIPDDSRSVNCTGKKLVQDSDIHERKTPAAASDVDTHGVLGSTVSPAMFFGKKKTYNVLKDISPSPKVEKVRSSKVQMKEASKTNASKKGTDTHCPVYKRELKADSSDDISDAYAFVVDENESPVKKKKRTNKGKSTKKTTAKLLPSKNLAGLGRKSVKPLVKKEQIPRKPTLPQKMLHKLPVVPGPSSSSTKLKICPPKESNAVAISDPSKQIHSVPSTGKQESISVVISSPPESSNRLNQSTDKTIRSPASSRPSFSFPNAVSTPHLGSVSSAPRKCPIASTPVCKNASSMLYMNQVSGSTPKSTNSMTLATPHPSHMSAPLTSHAVTSNASHASTQHESHAPSPYQKTVPTQYQSMSSLVTASTPQSMRNQSSSETSDVSDLFDDIPVDNKFSLPTRMFATRRGTTSVHPDDFVTKRKLPKMTPEQPTTDPKVPTVKFSVAGSDADATLIQEPTIDNCFGFDEEVEVDVKPVKAGPTRVMLVTKPIPVRKFAPPKLPISEVHALLLGQKKNAEVCDLQSISASTSVQSKLTDFVKASPTTPSTSKSAREVSDSIPFTPTPVPLFGVEEFQSPFSQPNRRSYDRPRVVKRIACGDLVQSDEEANEDESEIKGSIFSLPDVKVKKSNVSYKKRAKKTVTPLDQWAHEVSSHFDEIEDVELETE